MTELMDDLDLATCGPDPVPVADAVRAVRGYAAAHRWLYVQTPSHPQGHWVRVPAYPFGVFDAQPADDGADTVIGSLGAAEGLHGVPRDLDARFAFHREAEGLVPLLGCAVRSAAETPFWALPSRDAVEGPLVDALDAARALSQPDHGSALLHHRRPELFPLVSRSTLRVIGPVAAARGTTPWAVIHDDLVRNAAPFEVLETTVSEVVGRPLTRLRLHDLITWLQATRRWADALTEGAGVGG